MAYWNGAKDAKNRLAIGLPYVGFGVMDDPNVACGSGASDKRREASLTLGARMQTHVLQQTLFLSR